MLDWFNDVLRMLFTFLDRIVYSLITYLYQLILYLANLDLFGMSTLTTDPDNVIANFSSRVYALLGIFMLFKISFSILQYMVNPDEFSDKSKGFGKMVTNILVSLCLIVAVPFIFQYAFKIQGAILESNFLGQLILGNTVTNQDSTDEAKDEEINQNEEMAEDLQFLVYGSFFSVDTTVGEGTDLDASVCKDGPVLGTKKMAQSTECLDYLASVLEDVGGANKLGDFFAAGGADSVDRRFDAFGEVVNIRNDGKYVFNYMSVVSTIAGGFVVVMLLSFCFDVATRIIKLGFLEIIAPIPIISYMDPKQSGKDGMLGRWASECFKTYLSLFIRLAIIYFAFFVVDLVANSVLANPTDQIYLNNEAPEGLMAVFVQLMVILGVFVFAKEVPKLLESLIPGMKGAGDLNLNPLKNPIAAGAIGGIVGAGVGSLASGVAAFSAARDEEAKLGTSIRRGLGGAAGGVFRGAKAGIASGGKQTFSKAMDVAGVAGRNAVLKTNTNWRQRMGAYTRQAVGMQSKKEGLDKQVGYHESIQKHASNMEARARDQLSKKSNLWKVADAQRSRLQQQYNDRVDIHTGEMESYLDDKGVQRQREKIIKAGTKEYDKYYTDQMYDLWKKQDSYIEAYINRGGKFDGLDSDYQIELENKAMRDEIKENDLDYLRDNQGNVKENASWKEIKDVGKAAEEKAMRIKNSEEYRDADTLDKMQRSGIMQQHFGSKH